MLTNKETKRLFWLLDSYFFSSFNTDAAILKIDDYHLWYCLGDNKTRVYFEDREVYDPDQSLFFDLLIGEFFYQTEELGNKNLIKWVDGTY